MNIYSHSVEFPRNVVREIEIQASAVAGSARIGQEYLASIERLCSESLDFAKHGGAITAGRALEKRLRFYLAADWPTNACSEKSINSLHEIHRACMARIAIEDGRDVPRAELAALAGASSQNIRDAIKAKRLRDRERPNATGAKPQRDITASSAMSWLKKRNVTGL